MPTALVDSNVVIAARIANDQRHAAGRAITEAIETGKLPIGRIPEHALIEILNYIHTRIGSETAIETLDGLQASTDFELDETTKSDLDGGRSLFRQYEGLSATDAILVAYMRRTGIEYVYSFDDDFDTIDGITRLDTPANPY